MSGVCKYTHVGLIVEPFGFTVKQPFLLLLCTVMWQYKSIKILLKKMGKKEKERMSRKVTCRPHNETWLLQFSCLLVKVMASDWIHWAGGGTPEEVVGRNPQNTTSAEFHSGSGRNSQVPPRGREFQLDDVMLWISSGIFDIF